MDAEPSPTATAAFICRFCQGAATEPGSTCPHCGREVMAVCPECKRYVDNQRETCDACGTPLAQVGHLARALSAPDAARQQTPTPDERWPAPPRTLSEAQQQEAILHPLLASLAALIIAVLFDLAILRSLIGSNTAEEGAGITLTIALVIMLYPAAVIYGSVRTAQQRWRLLRDGMAVRGTLERVEGRNAQHRLSQLVTLRFVDLRGEERYGAFSPLGSVLDLAPGQEVTVLYLPDEPAQCSVHPFLF